MTIRTKVLLSLVTLISASVLLVGSVSAQSSETKPGWGFGDTNHIHTGPPGQSVNPGGNGDNDRDDFSFQLRQEIRHFIAQLQAQILHNLFRQA